jgi:hypothetical protein
MNERRESENRAAYLMTRNGIAAAAKAASTEEKTRSGNFEKIRKAAASNISGIEAGGNNNGGGVFGIINNGNHEKPEASYRLSMAKGIENNGIMKKNIWRKS